VRSGRGRLRAPRRDTGEDTEPRIDQAREVGPQALDREVGAEHRAAAAERVEHDLGHVADQFGVDAVDERALAGQLDVDVGVVAELCERVAPRLPRDRHARVDQDERQAGMVADELQRRRELVRKDLQLEDEPERGQLREVFVERTVRRPIRP
jgi:hypothetical protein